MRVLLALPMAAAAVTACVTINVYFPAAAAEKAADRVIDEVWGKGGAPAEKPAPAPVSFQLPRFTLDGVVIAVLNAVVPAAHAQGEVNLDATTPEIKQLQAAMAARHPDLLPHYTSGAVGIAADGGLAVRELNAVPLPQRNAVKKLVADENADRSALYREIARANGHPEWEDQIRSTFAKRWAARAQAGWWVQGSSAWTQK